jgi:hypothetical protein
MQFRSWSWSSLETWKPAGRLWMSEGGLEDSLEGPPRCPGLYYPSRYLLDGQTQGPSQAAKMIIRQDGRFAYITASTDLLFNLQNFLGNFIALLTDSFIDGIHPVLWHINFRGGKPLLFVRRDE